MLLKYLTISSSLVAGDASMILLSAKIENYLGCGKNDQSLFSRVSKLIVDIWDVTVLVKRD